MNQNRHTVVEITYNRHKGDVASSITRRIVGEFQDYADCEAFHQLKVDSLSAATPHIRYEMDRNYGSCWTTNQS